MSRCKSGADVFIVDRCESGGGGGIVIMGRCESGDVGIERLWAGVNRVLFCQMCTMANIYVCGYMHVSVYTNTRTRIHIVHLHAHPYSATQVQTHCLLFIFFNFVCESMKMFAYTLDYLCLV